MKNQAVGAVPHWAAAVSGAATQPFGGVAAVAGAVTAGWVQVPQPAGVAAVEMGVGVAQVHRLVGAVAAEALGLAGPVALLAAVAAAVRARVVASVPGSGAAP